jgi:F-type H+-transporting ATPase subunit delta
MRGASADSLHSLAETLDAAVDAGADAGRIGGELFGVSEILRREPSLRRVATDQSVAPLAKEGLVRQLFGDRLDHASMELVSKAVGRRWTATRDLGDALEHLGVVAVVKSADKAGQGDKLEDELFGFGRLVAENSGLRDALSDPARSQEDKGDLLRGLLEGRATAATVRLAEQSVAGAHRTVSVAIEEYQKIAAANRSRLVGTVRVARELDDASRRRLEDALRRHYDRDVHLNVLVDPDVVGGIRVEIGDDVIDGTVASRLDEARRRLAG